MSNKSMLVVAGREVMVVKRTEPYEKINVIAMPEEVVKIENTIRYYYKGLSITVTMDELDAVSPLMAYIMRNYID